MLLGQSVDDESAKRAIAKEESEEKSKIIRGTHDHFTVLHKWQKEESFADRYSFLLSAACCRLSSSSLGGCSALALGSI